VGIVACLHQQDLERLQRHLEMSMVDLCGPKRTTRIGASSLTRFWSRMGLHCGDRIRMVVNGEVVAFATIAGEPQSHPGNEVPGISQSAAYVYLKEIVQLPPPLSVASCCQLRVQQGHRFDGSETSKLDPQDELDTRRKLSPYGASLQQAS